MSKRHGSGTFDELRNMQRVLPGSGSANSSDASEGSMMEPSAYQAGNGSQNFHENRFDSQLPAAPAEDESGPQYQRGSQLVSVSSSPTACLVVCNREHAEKSDTPGRGYNTSHAGDSGVHDLCAVSLHSAGHSFHPQNSKDMNSVDLASDDRLSLRSGYKYVLGCGSTPCEREATRQSLAATSYTSLKSQCENLEPGIPCVTSTSIPDGSAVQTTPSYGDGKTFVVDQKFEPGSPSTIPQSMRPPHPDIYSTSHGVWTTEQDDFLVHLRDVAQLTWSSLALYFPGIMIAEVKRRYEVLNPRCQTTKETMVRHRPKLTKTSM